MTDDNTAHELSVMASTLEALKSLDEEGRKRVLTWLVNKLDISEVVQESRNHRVRHSDGSGHGPERGDFEGTINTVAIRLGADSCRKLLVAAAAYLSIAQRQQKFTREQWLTCAKEARMWKADYSAQVSININRLLASGEVIEKAKNVYALSVTKFSEMEQKIAE